MATSPNAVSSSSNRSARAPSQARDAGRPASRWLIVALLTIAVLLALGFAGYVYSSVGNRAAAPAPAAPLKPIFVSIEPMTVNLQSEGRARFLHVGMALKVADEGSRAQVTEFMPELRSRTLLLLSNRQPDSLQTPQDKARLAEEIRAELNRPLSAGLPQQGITGVSFNTFVVQ